jgi:hypothetical protein
MLSHWVNCIRCLIGRLHLQGQAFQENWTFFCSETASVGDVILKQSVRLLPWLLSGGYGWCSVSHFHMPAGGDLQLCTRATLSFWRHDVRCYVMQTCISWVYLSQSISTVHRCSIHIQQLSSIWWLRVVGSLYCLFFTLYLPLWTTEVACDCTA